MKKLYLTLIILVLIFGAGFMMIKSPKTTGNVIEDPIGNKEVKDITIGFKNYNYYPNQIKLKLNQPVRIHLEDKVFGCYRSFSVRKLGITKYLATSKDYVEFTPTKKGKYPFSCSMGMGTGMFIVE